MEFKGTKGEWYTKNGQICSSIYCGEQQLALRASSKPEARADIILMSKAPEMLEMLKILIQDIEDGNYSRQTGYDLEEAKKLIKSATTI